MKNWKKRLLDLVVRYNRGDIYNLKGESDGVCAITEGMHRTLYDFIDTLLKQAVEEERERILIAVRDSSKKAWNGSSYDGEIFARELEKELTKPK